MVGEGDFFVKLAETPQEREAVFRLRYQVYVEEMGKRLASADHGRRLLTDPLDDTALIFFARDPGGEVAATLRCHEGLEGIPRQWWARFELERFERFGANRLSFSSRLMVAPQWRSSSVLAALLLAAFRHGLERGVRFNFCDCAPGLVNLYERLGYRRYTGNFVDPEYGFSIPLVLLVEDVEYLRAVHSPFGRPAAEAVPNPLPSDWYCREYALQTGHRLRNMLRSAELWSLLAVKLHDVDVPLFGGLAEEERRVFLRDATVISCRAGTPIVRRGDEGAELFVILEGSAAVRVGDAGRQLTLEYLGRGDVFGEMAFLSRMPRSADVVALADAEVLVLNQAFLNKLMTNTPAVAARILLNLARILCERLRTSTRHLAEIPDEDAEGPPAPAPTRNAMPARSRSGSSLRERPSAE